jgi:hypothetical protein
MKKNLLLIACVLLFSAAVSAQEETVFENENVSEKQQKKSLITSDGSPVEFTYFWKRARTKHHWGLIKAGFSNTTTGFEDILRKPSSSIFLSVAPVSLGLNINKHWLFITGMSYDVSIFNLKGDMSLEKIDGVVQFVHAPEGQYYKTSTLQIGSISVPLLLEYQKQINPKNTFFVIGGIEPFFYSASAGRDIRDEAGKQIKHITEHLINGNLVSARLSLQIGINDISLYGSYQPFSVFRSGKGPDLHPWAIGLALGY